MARRVDRMAGLEAEGVHTFAMDVTDEASMVGGIERIIAEQGRIDVLVNNAGYGSYGAVEDVPLDEARRQFEVNLFGLARLVQLVTPHMREQGSGRIINISSIGAVFYEPFGAWYHATKFAVDGFSDSLRVELRPFGIDVVLIHPAGIVTEWNEIARTSLVERSKDGVYAASAVKAAKAMESVDNPRMSSGPEVVAKTIVKAATARRPKVALRDRQGREHGDDRPPRAAGPRLRRDPDPACTSSDATGFTGRRCWSCSRTTTTTGLARRTVRVLGEELLGDLGELQVHQVERHAVLGVGRRRSSR